MLGRDAGRGDQGNAPLGARRLADGRARYPREHRTARNVLQRYRSSHTAPPLAVDPYRLTCGVRVLTVFPSPPPLKGPSDQRRSVEPGGRRPREGLDPRPNERVHHTSLSVFAPPAAGQVFRPLAGAPDKSSAPSSRRRGGSGMVRPVGQPMARKPITLGICGRSSWRTARPGTSAARPSSGTTTAHDGSPTGAQPRGSTPLRTFAGPTSSSSSCTAVVRAPPRTPCTGKRRS
jgi:hypothetical protein